MQTNNIIENIVFVNSPGKEWDGMLNFLLDPGVIYLGLDTETTGVDPLIDKVLLISIGNKNVQYVIDVARMRKHLDPFRKVFQDPEKIFLLHNAKFDYKFLKQDLGIELINIHDSMLTEMLLVKGKKDKGFGLDDVVSKYVGVALNKEIRKTFIEMAYGDTFTDEQVRYSAQDVEYLETVYSAQIRLIKKYALEVTYVTEMHALLPTGDLELNGMYLNKDKWLEAETQAVKDRDVAKLELDALFAPLVGEDLFSEAAINYNSPKQLLPAIKTLVGAPAKDLANTKEQSLKEINHPVIKALLMYREKEKRITTYGRAFLDNIHQSTGRIHSQFSQLYTDTGRYSSDSPNLQNIPRDKQYRAAFTGRNDNYRIVGCDYSGMELRILADLSNEPSWIECFERNGDLHSEIGSKIFGKSIRAKGTLGPDDPGENPELRQFAKTLNFGISYGMGPKKLARETGMPFDQARIVVREFWKQHPQIKGYFDRHVKMSTEAEVVRSPYDGRLRWLVGYDMDNPAEAASVRNLCMNFPMQSGNASITKKAMYLLKNHLKGKDAMLVSTIHDEILIEAHKDIADEILILMKKDMIDAAREYIKRVPVTVEGHVAMHWKK
jgi:DNA polymerase I